MRRTTFHELRVGRFVVTGEMSADGPCIQVLDTATKATGGVAIGPSALRRFTPDWGTDHRNGWWLVKYDNQPRFLFESLRDREADLIAEEFGIELISADRRHRRSFVGSRAWLGLVDWTASNPKLAQRWAGFQSYLPDWHAQAVEHGRRAGIAPPAFLARPRRARKAETARPQPVEPPCPRLDDAEAARLTTKLVMLVEDGMLEHLEAAQARSLVTELASCEGAEDGAPPRPDGDLRPAELALRSSRQMALVEDRLGVPDRWAARILTLLQPTGEPTWGEAQRLGHDLPDAGPLGLPPTDDDRPWLDAATAHATAFDRAARRILALVPMTSFAATPWTEAGEVVAWAERARAHKRGPENGWTFEPTPAAMQDAATLELAALAAVRDLWALLASLGPAPFLMPLRRMSLSLQRNSEWSATRPGRHR